MKQPLYIYNIYPRLYQDSEKWYGCVLRAKEMGFNTIFLNAFFECGSSNSIYSINNYYAFDKLSFSKYSTNPKKEVMAFVDFCHEHNMLTLVDLVINHTAPDSYLVKKHKNWYDFDETGAVMHAGTPEGDGFHVWEDTAKLKYFADDRNKLKKYMLQVCKYYLSFGFDGFRCDVANFVDPTVWDYIIAEIRKIKPDAIFVGEAFVCPVETMTRMGISGFDCIFNSSKWWDYEGDWLLDQYNETKKYLSTISFAETHDTERLITTCNFDYELFLQRIYFSGLFSKNFYLPNGLEFAFKNKISVFSTTSDDMEEIEHDFTDEIKELLEIKSKYKPLHEESDTMILHNDSKYICMQKTYEDEIVLIIINKTHKKLKVKLKKDGLINPKKKIDGKRKRKVKLNSMQVVVLNVTDK